MRQSRPDSDLAIQVQVLETFYVVTTSLDGVGRRAEVSGVRERDLIRTSECDKYSGLIKIITHLDHISHCETASGTNWSNRWTYQVSLTNTRRD